MGKNQQHKAQQRSKHAGDGEDLPDGDTSVDVSFHTPEWHAARLAALTTERKTWEEWKLEQKQAASALAAVEEDEDRQNRYNITIWDMCTNNHARTPLLISSDIVTVACHV